MNEAVNNLFNQQNQQAQQAQQAYPEDIANFNLIAATNKTSPRAPDFFGSTKINGAWFMLSAWLVFSRSGKQMINTAMRPATQQEAARQEQQQAQYEQNNPQQGNHQGSQQNATTGFVAPSQPQYAQSPATAGFGQPAQTPQQQAYVQPAQAQGATAPFNEPLAPWENQAQLASIQSANSSANPLEEDVEVVHVDLPPAPSF